MRFVFRHSLFSCLLIVTSCGVAYATNYTWTGAGSAPKNYQDPANWSPSGIPGSGDQVVFSTADTVTFFNNAGASYANVSSASLTATQSGGDRLWGINNVLSVSNNATLNISGGLDVSPFSLAQFCR